ncbi:MAG: AI-2E family transporter [Burkholderiaceae bacterium]
MPFSFDSEQKEAALWLLFWFAVLALLFLLGPVLAPFIAAAVLAYALNPGVDRLSGRLPDGRRMRFALPRPLAVIVVMLFVAAALLAIVLIVIPVLAREVPLLQQKIPVLLDRLDATLGPRLREFGLPVTLDMAGIKELVTERIATSGPGIWATVLASARVGGSAVIGWLATLLLTPVVLFYLLLDWHVILFRLEQLVPRRWSAKTIALAKEVDGLLAQYLRGQLLVMLILAAYYSTALAAAGFDVALPVGLITGFLAFVPYVGYGLGLLLALTTAMLQFDGYVGVLAVAGIYGIGQMLEGFYLTPRLVGERIGLHPLAVIFALLAFGQLFGFVGVLLALPASAAISVAVAHIRLRYLNSRFYNLG